ncbi:hypothetical protein AVEN_87844-1 [Araneus ventricosus]|uniref:Uncharacterized protein n=1 Tax=Araneus ventricosus TaxID=182803 RepID=A0A4Y2BCM5_ARAVE|nr:hypothetical protein AVEN_87844-1 [Araneus ventricosus]
MTSSIDKKISCSQVSTFYTLSYFVRQSHLKNDAMPKTGSEDQRPFHSIEISFKPSCLTGTLSSPFLYRDGKLKGWVEKIEGSFCYFLPSDISSSKVVVPSPILIDCVPI